MRLALWFMFCWLVLSCLFAQKTDKKVDRTIRPDGAIKPTVTFRRVDLSNCMWVDIDSEQFHLRFDTVTNEHKITIMHPGIAQCATDK